MGECVLSADGCGPRRGHCKQCDELTAVAYRVSRYSGRGIDAIGVKVFDPFDYRPSDEIITPCWREATGYVCVGC